jgi:starch synthase (maltosyl-transferring)
VSLYGREIKIFVDRKRAGFGTWYEFFPYSTSPEPGRAGTFRDAVSVLPRVAAAGFDVVYLPPFHPIGKTNRKGKNNSPSAETGDPGSPWAIGSGEGGHKTVDPALGGMEGFELFHARVRELGMELAMDLAFQSSPDHPYVKEHPGWFNWRPDGTVQFAENPPKKYEDIIPFNFETADWRALWEELKSIVLFWVEKGVRIFRVDNPHTKPFAFWQWLIWEVKKDYPDVLFLSEAFTRPRVMYRLAKLGFSQSYTYFTWRNGKKELMEYMNELTRTPVREYLRPNFFVNTPDILPEFLQYGGRPAFVIRLILAATLSSNYGVYGPAFELQWHEARPGTEEYLDSEKYEIKHPQEGSSGDLFELMALVNRIRRENPALQETNNIEFYETDNDSILFYGKSATAGENQQLIFTVVSVDPFRPQSGSLRMPLAEIGVAPGEPFLMHDLLSGDRFIWHGEWNRVELSPHFLLPARIFRIRKRMRREYDFDYFM